FVMKVHPGTNLDEEDDAFPAPSSAPTVVEIEQNIYTKRKVLKNYEYPQFESVSCKCPHCAHEGISLLVQVQEEATAKYKKIACFAFPFWFLIFGSLLVLNIYNAHLMGLKEGGPFMFVLMFFGTSIFIISVTCCCLCICGDADKISLHFCVECRQQMNDVEPGSWYKDKNIGRNRKLDEDIEVTFVDTSANFDQTPKKIVTNLVVDDDDAEKSNSEAPKIIKVKQNIAIKEGKILRKYPKTSVYCKCPKCKVDGMTIIKKGKICDSPAGAEECCRRFNDLLPRFLLSFIFIFIFSVFLFLFSLYIFGPEIRESINAEVDLERFIFFVFVLIIISCGYGLNTIVSLLNNF
ncbi:unnamed protein product, partial [Oikopleura dioica]